MSSRLLTTHGVRKLYHHAVVDVSIKLQVLGIYRYMADPALKERLGKTFADARDVFDILLSDGRHKMKAVLAQQCHKLVWTRVLTTRCIIRVIKSKVFEVDEMHTHRVVLLQDVAVASLNDDGMQPDKVVARRYDQTTNLLEFISTNHPREVALLPLVGDRLYYLPLGSDDYTLDWACSFTDGQPDEDSPLDELESNHLNHYEGNESSGNQQLAITSVAWNSVPNYCSSLFTSEYNKLHTILEVLGEIKKNKQQEANQNLNLPMLGAIRVKSKVKNVGDPDISNPFPFVFNAVVVDATGVFEVMFFGSMCAKYFLSLHEGDLIHFRGYAATTPQELQWTTTTSPFVWYPDNSSGQAYHVPKKYWKFLEMAKVAPRLLDHTPLLTQQAASGHLRSLRPSWLECNFVTTSNTRYLGKKASNHLDAMYFDFVGVLSSVQRICRKRTEDASKLIEFRWVKLIDGSSPYELVVKIGACSQPAVFRALAAGNTLMLTKLQWVILPGDDTATRIQYAKTSDFSILRTNEAVLPFQSLEECNLNVQFANKVNKNAVLVSHKVSEESKLTALIEKKYRPLNRLPTGVQAFKNAFELDVYSFSDLSLLLSKMEAYDHRHVGFVGQVNAIRNGDDPTGDQSPVMLELNEAGSTDQVLTVAVSLNDLFQRPDVKAHILATIPSQSLPFIRLLPSILVDEMYSKASKDGLVSHMLSLEFIESYLICLKREYFFSLQLYRDGSGHVTWEVDAILAMP